MSARDSWGSFFVLAAAEAVVLHKVDKDAFVRILPN